MGIEETYSGISLHFDKASHLSKKLDFMECLMVRCLNWTCTRLTEKWLNLPKEGETVLQGSFLMIESSRHSGGSRRKWLTNSQYRWNSLSNFLLHGKICWILWACRLKMNAPTLWKNFGWLSWQQLSLLLLEF